MHLRRLRPGAPRLRRAPLRRSSAASSTEAQEAAALEDLARTLLAVRDFANTPLQTIASATALARPAPPRRQPSSCVRIERALSRMQELNSLLARHETPHPLAQGRRVVRRRRAPAPRRPLAPALDTGARAFDRARHARHRSPRKARPRRRRRRRRRLRLRHRQVARRSRRLDRRRHLAAGLGIFKTMLERGKLDESRQLVRRRQARVRDASTRSTPTTTRSPTSPPRCASPSATASTATSPSTGCAARLRRRLRRAPVVDIVVHSLANGPEVKKPLLETSRKGYLAAVGVSSLLVHLARAAPRPAGAPGRQLPRAHATWRRSASSPATAAACRRRRRRSRVDTRTLAFEAGRKWGHRVNVHLRRAVRVARGVGDRLHRADDRLLQGQLAAARGAHRARGRRHRGVPAVSPLGVGHHRHHDLRRQGLPRDGRGGDR